MKRLLLLLLPSLALAQPSMPRKVRLPDPPPDVSAKLAEAIRARDAKAIVPLLRKKGTLVRGMWFPDAACTRRFGKEKKLKKAGDLTALARCLAKLELQPTTRRSQSREAIVLTYAPGIEIELAVDGGQIYYAGYVHHVDHQQPHVPTLTAQAFEALRSSGSTNVDAAVEHKLAAEVSKRGGNQVAAWLEVCLDAKGKAKTAVAEATTVEIGRVLLAATANWTFQPFTTGKRAVPVCSQSLITYPAANAPKTEVLPSTIIPAAWELEDDAGGVEGGVVGGVAGGGEWTPGVGWSPSSSPPPPPPPPPPAPPQNVPPTLLEAQRIAGTKIITPDAKTAADIVKSGKAKIVGSFKLCLDTTGAVTKVTLLKSTGFPAYDQKLQREMRAWAYRPYLVNGKAVPVCTAVTFIYSP